MSDQATLTPACPMAITWAARPKSINMSSKLCHLKGLMLQGRYQEARSFGEKTIRRFGNVSTIDDIQSTVMRDEFILHYTKALIYAGATGEGTLILKDIIARLEGRRKPEDVAWQGNPHIPEGQQRNWVVGQAHNHLGYLYWMNLGHYRLALNEFSAALHYFHASNLWEEYANTCDNIGRVCAQLHQPSLAKDWINKGLELRGQILLCSQNLGGCNKDPALKRKQENMYRIALSFNSLATVHLIFKDLQKALQWSVEALETCEELDRQRGTGLANITLGRSSRLLATDADTDSHEEGLRLLDQAAARLTRALSVFERRVFEPIRLIEVYNELGCVYREWAVLIRRGHSDSAQVKHFHHLAVQYLTAAIELAEEKNVLLYVDSCKNLARTYLENGQFNKADWWMQTAERAVPETYKIKRGSEPHDIPVEECIEEFWYQMSKIERLRGDLASKCKPRNGRKPGSASELGARYHYALAAAYRQQYSKLATELNDTVRFPSVRMEGGKGNVPQHT